MCSVAAETMQSDLDTHAAAVVDSISNSSPPPNIPFSVLAVWTNNFSIDNLIGEGAFGMVYQAICHDAHAPRARVAIKRHLR